jgi:hypothetical protein
MLNNPYLAHHLIPDQLEVMKMYKEDALKNYELNKVSMEDISNHCREYGIRTKMMTAYRPDVIPSSWNMEETSLDEIKERFSKMDSEQKRTLFVTIGMQMGIDGIEFDAEAFTRLMEINDETK